MYRLLPNDSLTNAPTAAVIRLVDCACIPFDPANTDYQAFKAEILVGSALLQDAEGGAMPGGDAHSFVAALP